MYRSPSVERLKCISPHPGTFVILPDRQHYLAPVSDTYGIFSMLSNDCLCLLEGPIESFIGAYAGIGKYIDAGQTFTIIVAACTMPGDAPNRINIWNWNNGQRLRTLKSSPISNFDAIPTSNIVLNKETIRSEKIPIVTASCRDPVLGGYYLCQWRADTGKIFGSADLTELMTSIALDSTGNIGCGDGETVIVSGKNKIQQHPFNNLGKFKKHESSFGWIHHTIAVEAMFQKNSCAVIIAAASDGNLYVQIYGKKRNNPIELKFTLRAGHKHAFCVEVVEQIVRGVPKTVIISGGLDGTIKIWDLDERRCLKIINTSHAVYCLGIGQSMIDGRYCQVIMSGGPGQKIQRWDFATGRLISESRRDRISSIAT